MPHSLKRLRKNDDFELATLIFELKEGQLAIATPGRSFSIGGDHTTNRSLAGLAFPLVVISGARRGVTRQIRSITIERMP